MAKNKPVDADKLAINGPWKDAVKHALARKAPAGGWPERPGIKKRRKKGRKH